MGIPYSLHGEGVRITPETIPDVIKLADVMKAAVNAGKLLGRRLREGHNRTEIARKMQNVMMSDSFEGSYWSPSSKGSPPLRSAQSS